MLISEEPKKVYIVKFTDCAALVWKQKCEENEDGINAPGLYVVNYERFLLTSLQIER